MQQWPTWSKVHAQLTIDLAPHGKNITGTVSVMAAEPALHSLGIAEHGARQHALVEQQSHPHMAPQIMVPQNALHLQVALTNSERHQVHMPHVRHIQGLCTVCHVFAGGCCFHLVCQHVSEHGIHCSIMES